jgi:hypothetical protein
LRQWELLIISLLTVSIPEIKLKGRLEAYPTRIVGEVYYNECTFEMD